MDMCLPLSRTVIGYYQPKNWPGRATDNKYCYHTRFKFSNTDPHFQSSTVKVIFVPAQQIYQPIESYSYTLKPAFFSFSWVVVIKCRDVLPKRPYCRGKYW